MQQIVDLENDPAFQALDVELVSIAFDSTQELQQGASEFGIGDVPLLTDTEQQVSQDYGVLEWAVASGEPGHTFVLVDQDGNLAWIRDYGAPENGGSCMCRRMRSPFRLQLLWGNRLDAAV